jgi:hypothetical protein
MPSLKPRPSLKRGRHGLPIDSGLIAVDARVNRRLGIKLKLCKLETSSSGLILSGPQPDLTATLAIARCLKHATDRPLSMSWVKQSAN